MRTTSWKVKDWQDSSALVRIYVPSWPRTPRPFALGDCHFEFIIWCNIYNIAAKGAAKFSCQPVFSHILLKLYHNFLRWTWLYHHKYKRIVLIAESKPHTKRHQAKAFRVQNSILISHNPITVVDSRAQGFTCHEMILPAPKEMSGSRPICLWHKPPIFQAPWISQKLFLAFQEHPSEIWPHSDLKHHEDRFRSSKGHPTSRR